MTTAAKPARKAAPAKAAAMTKAVADPAPATDVAASGAVIEEAVVAAIPLEHPAVDANPRAGTTADQNRIDFNDPSKSGTEAVADALAAQQN